MIDCAEISASLSKNRTKKNVSRIVNSMETVGVDLSSYLDEI